MMNKLLAINLQITILVLLCVLSFAQNRDPNPHFPIVTIPVSCTEGFINSYKGKWLIHNPALGPTSVNEYHDEAVKRLNQIQNLVYQTYPQPMGSDAAWNGSFGKTSFADEVKYELVNGDEWEAHAIIKNPIYRYTYGLVLCDWFCFGEKQIKNGYPEAMGAGLVIKANSLEILNEDFLPGNEWILDGRPIKKKMFTIAKLRGLDVMAGVGGIYADAADSHFLLISRQGMLPYIPITRKQYLDRAVLFITRTYDELTKKMLKNNGELPPQFRSPQEEIANQIASNTKAKNSALKKLHDELEKTTQEGLLDAPAVVRLDPLFTTEGPVFLPESEGGCLLATENPNYLRKDLPKYAPQFFVIEVTWRNLGWSMEFKKIIEENFPLDELQALIDK
jgi:hypothetical protein